jgi:hypothetical protein
LTEETIITDESTGGQKGDKPSRYDLIPAYPLDNVARAYGYGASKYAPQNWRKGYKWSLSFAALMRHAWAFWRGEDNDPESGLPHLAHAAFHCLTMMEFTETHTKLDDRVKREPAA